MDERIAVGCLRDVKEVFDRANIEFWLDTGTLLGAVREGRIIEWDADIDLGVMDNDCNLKRMIFALIELEKKGFQVYFEEGEFDIHFKNSKINEFFFRRKLHIYRERNLVSVHIYRGKAIRSLGVNLNLEI